MSPHDKAQQSVLREWLSQLASHGKAPSKLDKSMKPADVLLVVDMQNDLVGGSARVSESPLVEAETVKLIHHACKLGCKIVAVRSCHSANHSNFNRAGSAAGDYAFPPYCISGSEGSYFTTPVGDALTDAMKLSMERKEKNVHVCLKGMREDLRTFSAFPYNPKLAGQRLGLYDVTPDDPVLEFTGSFELRTSNIEGNINAHPDMRAITNRTPISEILWGDAAQSRLFICGLPLDFSVIDTACCASLAGKNPHIIIDATRPVCAANGRFVSDLEAHAKLLHTYQVKMCYSSDVLKGR